MSNTVDTKRHDRDVPRVHHGFNAATVSNTVDTHLPQSVGNRHAGSFKLQCGHGEQHRGYGDVAPAADEDDFEASMRPR